MQLETSDVNRVAEFLINHPDLVAPPDEVNTHIHTHTLSLSLSLTLTLTLHAHTHTLAHSQATTHAPH
jgi:hypothetical protein